MDTDICNDKSEIFLQKNTTIHPNSSIFNLVKSFRSNICLKVMSHYQSFLAKTEMLPLYPKNNTLNYYQFTNCFKNSLTWIFYKLFNFILHLVPTFLECVAAIKISLYLQNTTKLFSENIRNLYFELLSVK